MAAINKEKISLSDVDEGTNLEFLYRQAERMLKKYRGYLEERSRLEYELRHIQFYTYDDCLYLIAQGGHANDTERVQTSGISNPTEKAVMNAESLMKRLNADVLAECMKPLNAVNEKIGLIEIAFDAVDEETEHIAEQVFADRVPRKSVVSATGTLLSRTRVDAAIRNITEELVFVLKENEKIMAWEYDENIETVSDTQERSYE